MAIKTPKWVETAGAYPTVNGWTVDRPKGKKEVVKAAKFSAEEIAEWHGESGAEEAVIQTLHEAPVVEVEVAKPVYDFYSTMPTESSEQED